jgi:hypothetical protein
MTFPYREGHSFIDGREIMKIWRRKIIFPLYSEFWVVLGRK